MLDYTFKYQLLIYSCDSGLLSSFVLLCSYPSVQLFIMLFQLSYICSLSCYYSVHIIYMHELSSLNTLTRSLSDDPGFVVQILDALFLLFRCSLRLYASRRAGASPYSIPVFLSFLPSYYFLILVISDSDVILVFIYMISCVDSYM